MAENVVGRAAAHGASPNKDELSSPIYPDDLGWRDPCLLARTFSVYREAGWRTGLPPSLRSALTLRLPAAGSVPNTGFVHLTATACMASGRFSRPLLTGSREKRTGPSLQRGAADQGGHRGRTRCLGVRAAASASSNASTASHLVPPFTW